MSGPPSIWVIMRVTGTFHRDGGDGPKIDTGLPLLIYETTEVPLTSADEARVLAEAMMLKDGFLRWTFKSDLAGEIKKNVAWTKTNGSNVTAMERKK